MERFCSVSRGGGGTAYAKDPPALKDTYVIDGITYYNVNSSHINTPQLFYEDLLGATHSSLGGLSIAKYWLLVGAGLLEPGLATSFMYVQSIAQQYLLDGKNNSPLYMFGHSNLEWKDDHVEVKFTGVNTLAASSFTITAIFSDFSIVPLILGDKENYISTTIENVPPSTKTETANGLMNDSAMTVSLNHSVSNSFTTGFETSFTESNSYSFTEGLKIGTEFGLNILGADVKTTQELSLEFQQAFEKSWTQGKSESKAYEEQLSISVTAPPYTTALLSISDTNTTTTTRYNCPIGLSYKVTLQFMYHKEIPIPGYIYTFGSTGNAMSDLYNRAIKDGKKRTDPNSINWETFLKNSTTKSAIETITSHVPMSSTGATTSFNKKVKMYELQELAPLYPLRKIELANDSDSEKNLSIGGSFTVDNIQLKGLNSKNGEYYNFKAKGNWIVINENGDEITDGSGAIVLEKVAASGKMKCKAVKGGTAYLKFVIDEKSYPKTYINSNAYVTNQELAATAVIEVHVADEGITYKISGNYTGVALSEAELIEGKVIGKLRVRAYDKTGKEIVYPHVWDQAELFGDGMELTADGYVTFTEPGTYNVRVMNETGTSYSAWKEIVAEYYGDDEIVKKEIPDSLRVEATADTYIEIQGSFVGGVNNDAEKIEGDGKLKVRAYDQTEKEVALRYTWEQEKSDGMTLTADGTVSFTKPGLYHARIKSGEYYSDWIPIKANQYAPARFLHVPSNARQYYNGNAQELLNNDARLEGGVRIMYGLSSDDVTETKEYHSSIPEAVEIGKYYVWCQAIGDESHDNSAPVCVVADIIDASAKPENTVEGEKVEQKVSKTFTLSNSMPVCWKIDKDNIILSTSSLIASSLNGAAASDLIGIEVSPSDAETVPTSQITVTVSTIAGTTPASGEFEIPVKTSPTGTDETWTDKEAILFDVAEAVEENKNSNQASSPSNNNVSSSGGGCGLGLGLSGLMFALSALILKRKY